MCRARSASLEDREAALLPDLINGTIPMSKEYLDYWGLKKDPFHLAPDNEMMYLGGQYYECYERLLYAVNTNKGGALLVSEEAGLGKSSILLKLVAEMRWDLGDEFRCAFIDYPTLTSAQLLSQIGSSLLLSEPHADKSVNLAKMKEQLTQLKMDGGKALIVIDEAHTLCNKPEVLQDMRMLLNLTHDKEYLLTLILSGQKPLWGAMKAVPEFWQRLPVKYYLQPLRLDETKNLVTCRLGKAGFDEDREIFSAEAFEILHRFARGLPRTIVALCDLSLLVGASYHAKQIGFKEISKAIHAMSGKGESESLLSASGTGKVDKGSLLQSIVKWFRSRRQ
jgi:general secretion pathway protein A